MYNKQYHTRDLSNLQFLVTGGAGFIGSNIVEYLLKNGAKKVRVLDSFATGFFENIKAFMDNPSFELLVGDIRDFETCKKAVDGIDYITHQAALGSVPRSIDDPIMNNEVNITGFLNILCAAKETESVKRIIYAASSSTYGDNSDITKTENNIGKPLSPYAITKYVNELYADVFAKTYGMETIGLRYFNVFGPRQSPKGAYAAVIPLFIDAVKNDLSPTIHGDGEQTRDFTFVENAVQANIKAFFVENTEAVNQVYNIACGEKTSLNQLLEKINYFSNKKINGIHTPSRTGDIKNSWADISKAKTLLNYDPLYKLDDGIQITIN
ncbi:SDR family oxidoreductase [Mucilaginibacter sp.]|uniref:SDR family oxidoreductase n=1 Tax=Mucilaginibacter sp. TaxID=1882438 RepID=UPI00261B4FD5|nr:SDR family oxidoreductase [Mucilaginibacter sp.]